MTTIGNRMVRMEEEIGDIKGTIGELKGTVGGMKDALTRLRDERKEDNTSLRRELETNATALRLELGALVSSVNEMKETIASAKGSWRTLLGVATITATVVTAVSEIVHWLRK